MDLSLGGGKQGVVALVQIAFGKNVWILQVCVISFIAQL